MSYRHCAVLIALPLVLNLPGCQPQGTSGVITEPAGPQSSSSAPPPPPPPDQSNSAARDKRAGQIDPGLAGDVAMAAVPPDAKAFLSVSAKLFNTLGGITDGPSANAAAPRIKELAAQVKLHFPGFKRFMATAPDELLELVFQQQAADQQAAFGSNRTDLVALAKEPGNEAFRDAYVAYLHVLRDDGTIGTRRQADRELAKLQE